MEAKKTQKNQNQTQDQQDSDEAQQPIKPVSDAKEINEFEEKWKRSIADLENYRKQVERDRTDLARFSNEQCLITLLPVLDNFKRAADHLPEELAENDWAKGISAIEKQLEQTLEDLGLQKIPAPLGEPCDPNKHAMITTGKGKRNTVLEVLEDGYELNGKVLRSAKVMVGNTE